MGKGGGGLALFLFNFFKVDHLFYVKIALPIAKLCSAFEEKSFFFYYHNFMK